MNSISPQIDQNDKTDLRNNSLFLHLLPPVLRPYGILMRLDRPIGTWLLLLPAWWGLALAYPQNPDILRTLYLGVLFGVGAIIMRGAGCIINDLWDRDLDARVTRTQTRPLVTGAVTPRAAIQATVFLFLIGLAIVLQMNTTAILTALCSVPFIITYPLMKRITWWPQLFLGLTFNFGALIAWAAMTGTIGLPGVLLYSAGIFWTLGYDTIYAHMDRVDDESVGIKSSARALGNQTVPAIAGFYGASTLCLFLALYHGAASLTVLPALLAVSIAFIWQIRRLDIHNPALCLRLFKFNRDQGLMILLAIIVCVYTVI